MQETAENGWLSLAEAATALHCSVDTVRRRIKRGEITAKQVATQRGPAWRVLLGSLPGNLPPVEHVAPQPAEHAADGAGMVALVHLVGRLQEENRTLAGQVGFLQAQMQQAHETIRALQAGAEHEPSTTADPETSSPAPQADQPWWKRLLGLS